MNTYVLRNLLNLTGTVLVNLKGNVYNLPICLLSNTADKNFFIFTPSLNNTPKLLCQAHWCHVHQMENTSECANGKICIFINRSFLSQIFLGLSRQWLWFLEKSHKFLPDPALIECPFSLCSNHTCSSGSTAWRMTMHDPLRQLSHCLYLKNSYLKDIPLHVVLFYLKIYFCVLFSYYFYTDSSWANEPVLGCI